MSIALELYGSLILTVLGFVLPMITILLSLFPDGVRALSTKYENEKKQSEENIVNEAKKRESGKDIDCEALKKVLNSLEKRKRQAEARLSYLKPINLAIKISTPFVVAFVGVLVALQSDSPVPVLIALVASILSFGCGVRVLWTSLDVLVEVSEIANQTKRSTEDKIVELLSKLVEQGGAEKLFLGENELKVKFNGKFLKLDEGFEFSVNKKYEIPVSINNLGAVMAKKVEVGLIVPKDCLIEKASNLSILADKEVQIIRYNVEIIQANTEYRQGKLGATFLTAGEHKIETFIKGENVKPRKFAFKIKVIE